MDSLCRMAGNSGLDIFHIRKTAHWIPIQEVQKLLFVDAAASDAENLCM